MLTDVRASKGGGDEPEASVSGEECCQTAEGGAQSEAWEVKQVRNVVMPGSRIGEDGSQGAGAGAHAKQQAAARCTAV